MRKILMVLFMTCCMVGLLTSQTVLFESTFEADDPAWQFANSTSVNKWYRGTATANGGSYSMYISNNSGTSFAYTHTNTRSYVYRDFTVPANAINVSLTFDYKVGGESETYDFMRVYLLDTTQTPAGNTSNITATATSDPFWDNKKGGVVNDMYNRTGGDWRNDSIALGSIAGQTKRIAFMWVNDGSIGDNIPSAIDNVRITYALPAAYPPPATLVSPMNNATYARYQSTTFSWSAPVEGTAPTGYNLLYGTANNVNSMTSVSVGNVTSHTLPTSLNPSTTYYWTVQPYAGANQTPREQLTVWSFTTSAAGEYLVGDATSTTTDNSIPIAPYYKHSFSQTIYTQALVGRYGMVERVRYYFNGINALSHSNTWQIYMGTTNTVEFAGDAPANMIPHNTLTQVFSGTIPFTDTAGWVEITLDAPFAYSTGNLVVAVSENVTSDDDDGSNAAFRATATISAAGGGTSRNCSIYYKTDSSPLDLNNLTMNLTRLASFPTTILVMGDLASVPNISVNPNPIAFGSMAMGDSRSITVNIHNIGQADLTIASIALDGTAVSYFDIDSTAGATVPFSSSISRVVTFNATAPVNAAGTSLKITSNTGGNANTETVIPITAVSINADITVTGTPTPENFDTLTPPALPLGWVAINALSDASTVVTQTGNTPQSTPNHVAITNATGATSVVMLRSPKILNLNEVNMEFYAKTQISGHPLIIGYMSTTDPTSFVQIQTLSNLNTSYLKYLVMVPVDAPTEGYIAFWNAASAANIRMNIDDVSLVQRNATGVFLPPTETTRPLGTVVEGGNNNFSYTLGNTGGTPLTVNMTLPTGVTMPTQPGVAGNVITLPAASYVTVRFLANLTGATDYDQNIVFNASDGTAHTIRLTATLVTVPEGWTQIGAGTGSTNPRIPVNVFYNFSYSQSIYHQNEIGVDSEKQITHIAFDYNGGGSLSESSQWRVWIEHIPTTFTGFAAATATSWFSTETHQLVFDGTIPNPTLTTARWVELALDVPFLYNGTDNIVITVKEYTPSCGTSAPFFHYTESPGVNRTLMIFADNSAPYPDDMYDVTASGTFGVHPRVANLRLKLIEPPAGPSIAITPDVTTHAFGSRQINMGRPAQTFTLRNLGGGAITVSTPTLTGDAHFTLAHDLNVLAGAAISTVTVTYHPSAVGNHTATLNIPFSMGGESPIVITLTGTGVDDSITLPVEETFASDWPTYLTRYGGRLPVNGSNATLSSNTAWTPASYNNDSAHPNGYAAYRNIYGTSVYDWFMTPILNLNGLSGATSIDLTFDASFVGWSSSDGVLTGTDDRFIVLVSDDGTWSNAKAVRIWDNDPATNGAQYAVYNDLDNNTAGLTIPLIGYAGQCIQIAFYGESTVSNADNRFFVDNIKVAAVFADPFLSVAPLNFGAIEHYTSKASSVQLSNLGAAALRVTGVTFSGTNASYFSLASEFTPVVVELGTPVPIVVNYTPTAVSTGIHTADMMITWEPAAGGTSATYTAVVTGSCISVQQYTDTTFPPSGWERYTGSHSGFLSGTAPTLSTNSNGWHRADSYMNDATHPNSPGAARLEIFAGSYYHWLVSPVFDLGEAALQLRFDAAFTGYSYNAAPQPEQVGSDDKFFIMLFDEGGAMLAANHHLLSEWGATSTPLSSIPHTGATYHLPLASYIGKVRIAFYGESTVAGNGDNYLYIDGVGLEPMPVGSTFAISPDITNFNLGRTTVQETVYREFTVSNLGVGVGEDALKLNAIMLVDDNDEETDSEHYSIQLLGAILPQELGTGQSYRFRVNFAPIFAGTGFTARVRVSYQLGMEGTDHHHTISFTGDGIESRILPTPSTPYVQSFSVEPSPTSATSDVYNFWTRWAGSFNEQGVAVITEAPITTSWSSSSYTQWSVGNFSNMSGHSLGTAAKMNLCSTYNHWLVTPSIVIPENTALTLSMKMALTMYGSNTAPTLAQAQKHLLVLVSEYDGTSWSPWTRSSVVAQWSNPFDSANTTPNYYSLGAIANAGTDANYFYPATVDLSAYSGTIKVAFYGNNIDNSPDSYIYIDDVTFSVDVHNPARNLVVTAPEGLAGALKIRLDWDAPLPISQSPIQSVAMSSTASLGSDRVSLQSTRTRNGLSTEVTPSFVMSPEEASRIQYPLWGYRIYKTANTQDFTEFRTIAHDVANVAQSFVDETFTPEDVTHAFGYYVRAIYAPEGEELGEVYNLSSATVTGYATVHDGQTETLAPVEWADAIVIGHDVKIGWGYQVVAGVQTQTTRGFQGYRIHKNGTPLNPVEPLDPNEHECIDADVEPGDYLYEVEVVYDGGVSKKYPLIVSILHVESYPGYQDDFNTPLVRTLSYPNFPYPELVNTPVSYHQGWSAFHGALTTTVTPGFGSNWATATELAHDVFAPHIELPQNDWFVSPTINVKAGSETKLTFILGLANTQGAQVTTLADAYKLAVVVSTDNGVTWSSANTVKVWSTTASEGSPFASITPEGTKHEIDLSEYSGQIKIGFYAESNRAYNDASEPVLVLFVDDFRVVGALEDEDDVTPVTQTALHANYPNPFNPETTIKFALVNDTPVTIDVFNIKGQKVKSLVHDVYRSGHHQVVWNGKDDTGRDVSSGMYFYRMTTKDYSATKKMILLK